MQCTPSRIRIRYLLIQRQSRLSPNHRRLRERLTEKSVLKNCVRNWIRVFVFPWHEMQHREQRSPIWSFFPVKFTVRIDLVDLNHRM